MIRCAVWKLRLGVWGCEVFRDAARVSCTHFGTWREAWEYAWERVS